MYRDVQQEDALLVVWAVRNRVQSLAQASGAVALQQLNAEAAETRREQKQENRI